MDIMRTEHVEKYGEKFASHQKSIAKKTGSNVFFAAAKIPTRDELVDETIGKTLV